MTTQEKQQIANELKVFCDRKGSQRKGANSLKGVSEATVTHILTNKWDKIADRMWRGVKAQLEISRRDWVCVETSIYQTLTELIEDAQDNSQVHAIVASAGTGKTQTMKLYTENHPNAFMVQCNEFWNKKAFMAELLSAMGRKSGGMTIHEMVYEAVKYLKSIENPVILLDEFDKVNDQILYFFITFYNLLEDDCAIILCATEFLQKRIERGEKLNKKGYREIYSRLGRKFVDLGDITQQDCILICANNGITDKQDIKSVWQECNGDLRRVKKKIHTLKLERIEAIETETT
ncbi:AAA family ATPase [Capnocytophaga felis]|uniref:ORC1/DEAH AAA+ ATPase domain-containing protein n=1 Tax=Capnocytophaga felis TaxID=2267611 RepID=A0A5M4BA48_9FLAO|nr:AAA family ATPase [Capnocytophaga felis]GET46471.1 hypothetical protein RCZ01_17730 [Capnocytophaga felis]GET48361.1 hypothetical protein RCZ02_11920 [Capnocytophaga felis]